MKTSLCSLAVLGVLFLALGIAQPAVAQTLYENGPINGNVDAWTINFGFVVSDSFTISTGNSTLTGMSFGAWLMPGDVAQSVEVSVTSQAFGGTVYFDQMVNLTQSGCIFNQFNFDVCNETASFNGPTLANGSYWVNLQNAVTSGGNPVYWDENSGVGCHSPGCPSVGAVNFESIPSEAFSILGTSSGTGTTPEPSSLLLFASGVVALGGILRGKLR